MSLSVLFRLSATPFIVGEPGMVYCGTIPHSSRNLANGKKMYSDAKGMGVQWEIGENSFRFDFRIMELGPYDMVLGTDWMRSIGP